MDQGFTLGLVLLFAKRHVQLGDKPKKEDLGRNNDFSARLRKSMPVGDEFFDGRR